MEDYRGQRTVSKVKYYEFEKEIKTLFDEENATKVMDTLKKVLKMDPTISVYNEKVKERIMERRHKLREQGISTYISSGVKAFREKQKKDKLST